MTPDSLQAGSDRAGARGLLLVLSCLLSLAGRGAGAAGEPVFVELVEGREELILAAEQGPILLMSVPDLATVREFRGDAGSTLEGVAVSPNGRWLAADYRGGRLWVWDLQTGERRFTLPRAEPETAMSFLFHPREDLLYLFQDERLEQWDPVRGERLGSIDPIRGVLRMSISPDGRFLAAAGWCATGCADFSLCVYGLTEELVLAGTSLAALLGDSRHETLDVTYDPANQIVSFESPSGESRHEILDLTYTPEHQIVLTSKSLDSGFQRVTWVSPGTFRELGSIGGLVHHTFHFSGIRSAPRAQIQHLSSDGEWKVTLSPESRRLYLHRREPGGGENDFELKKLLRLP